MRFSRISFLTAAFLLAPFAMEHCAYACTDNSRACMTSAATALLEGMWKGEGAGVPLAPTVRKTENGGNNVTEGADAVRKQISGERLSGHSAARLFVDQSKHDVFAFWLAGAEPRAGHVAERIRVERGLIAEIEVFWVSDSLPFKEIKTLWRDASPPEPTRDSCDTSRACILAVADTYLDGLVNADGSKVKFAQSIRRTQNGGHVQEGDAILRASVARERLAFRRNFRVFADERSGNVIAVWLTGTNTVEQKSTAHVIERLKVAGGLISEIEVFYPLEQGVLDGTSGWPDDAP